MTYKKLYEDALFKLEHNKITLGEFEEMIEPLNREIEQEPRKGHWIGIDEEPHEVWECDHCGFVIDCSGCIDPYHYRDSYKFCPNCGAKMESEKEHE